MNFSLIEHIVAWVGVSLLTLGPALIVTAIVMTIFLPDKITKQYVREPHFHASIVYFNESFYFRCILTLVLTGMASMRWLARYRKAPDFAENCPRWWVVIARLHFWLMTFPMLVTVVVGWVCYFIYGGNPS